jgi:hypothetical protein
MLIKNPAGNYAFLKGISPYSAGAVAEAGYAIEHVRLHALPPLRRGFEVVEGYLKSIGRPKAALCGIELRSPRPFSFRGFSDFNTGYVEILKSWDLLQDGLNPVARTNVAPELNSPAEPSLFGFSYTVSASAGRPTFVVAGAGELPEGSLDPHDVVRRGETSKEALIEKARFVMELMDSRLKGLVTDWSHVTATNIYTVHDFSSWLVTEVLSRTHSAHLQGVTWHFSRPPIVSIEYEMDLRGCLKEVVI